MKSKTRIITAASAALLTMAARAPSAAADDWHLVLRARGATAFLPNDPAMCGAGGCVMVFALGLLSADGTQALGAMTEYMYSLRQTGPSAAVASCTRVYDLPDGSITADFTCRATVTGFTPEGNLQAVAACYGHVTGGTGTYEGAMGAASSHGVVTLSPQMAPLFADGTFDFVLSK